MKKMTLNNIHEWPLMTRLLLLGLIFAAVFYAGYRFNLAAQILKRSRAEQQESDIKQQIELTINKIKSIQSEVARLPAVKAELSKWKDKMINQKDMLDLQNAIFKIGGDNHLFFSLFTPGEKISVPVKHESSTTDVATLAAGSATTPAAKKVAELIYYKVPIKIVVVGNYHEIADFISQVANMSWIVEVGNFTISKELATDMLGDKMAKQAAAQHLLSAEIMIHVYHLPETL